MVDSKTNTILSEAKQKELDELYGLRPKQTTYRNAELLPVCEDGKETNALDQEWVEIH
jgi:hypothetical protein